MTCYFNYEQIVVVTTINSAIILMAVVALADSSIPDFRCGTPRIDAITKFANGSLFLASDNYYWIVSDPRYNKPTPETVSGRVSDLSSELDSVNAAVTFDKEWCGITSDDTATLFLFQVGERKCFLSLLR